MTLVIFGVALSIPIVIWGSGLLARLMARLWWIVDLGAAILGWVAGEMILGDRVVQEWLGGHPSPVVTRAVQGALAILVIVIGRAWARRHARRTRGRSRWIRLRALDGAERPRRGAAPTPSGRVSSPSVARGSTRRSSARSGC